MKSDQSQASNSQSSDKNPLMTTIEKIHSNSRLSKEEKRDEINALLENDLQNYPVSSIKELIRVLFEIFYRYDEKIDREEKIDKQKLFESQVVPCVEKQLKILERAFPQLCLGASSINGESTDENAKEQTPVTPAKNNQKEPNTPSALDRHSFLAPKPPDLQEAPHNVRRPRAATVS